MKRTPIGIENFGELVAPDNNYIFVDRTSLVQQVFKDGAKVIALHAFRRMGKSLFASMLQHFLSAKVIGVSTLGTFELPRSTQILSTHYFCNKNRHGFL